MDEMILRRNEQEKQLTATVTNGDTVSVLFLSGAWQSRLHTVDPEWRELGV
jgi:hypothetical protein